jgi:uncharacterized protein (DUF1501 family)
MNRRDFLKMALFGASTFCLRESLGWTLSTERKNSADQEKTRRLIVVFLRGAVDGLNVVIPYKESDYYSLRPNIAVPKPGASQGAQDLDGHFALHAALEPLFYFWNQGSLAFVHAAGSPDPTRSHFDAQDYMETGTPGVKVTSTGWMNRLLSVLPKTQTSLRAINVGPILPPILSGPVPVAMVSAGPAATHPIAVDRPVVSQAFDRLYGGNDPLSAAYREGMKSRKELLSDMQGSEGDLQKEMLRANRGAPLPRNYPQFGKQLAELITKDPNLQLAFLAFGGWDTHVNQGSSAGQLANHLQPLGEGLAELAKGLGSLYQDTVVMVISEFGRTVRENGNGGTDHGHGNAIWLLGGPVSGKKVYGKWPGLAASQLYENRDLPVTTDFRSVISSVLKSHMGLSSEQLTTIFPKFSDSSSDLSGLMRS